MVQLFYCNYFQKIKISTGMDCLSDTAFIFKMGEKRIMKKKILFISSGIVVLALATVVFFVWGNGQSYFETKKSSSQNSSSSASQSASTAKIGGTKTEMSISSVSSEAEVIQTMHEMTHQKVKADEKWGASPLTQQTASTVYEIVNSSSFDHKDQLLKIAKRWKNGDYSKIVSDHNYFWGLQGGTIGKATGTLSKIEEQTFILNNFGEEAAKQMKQDGEI